jgi:cellulose synthase (UDP-forming)
MVWFFPDFVRAHNYLPMIPALLATVIVFPGMARGWRPTIYRVCTINSACHVLAVFHALQDRVEEWVPTGMSKKGASAGKTKKKTDVPTRVNRILCIWIVVVQGLLWSGVALRVHTYGAGPYWATIVLGIYQFYMLAPMLLPSKGLRERRPKGRKPEPPMNTPVAATHHDLTILMDRI